MAVWANKLRSFLTVLGMVMGVTSVIAIVSTVEGMQKSIEDTFSNMGANSFTVTRFGFGLTWAEYLERLKRKKLTRELLEPIKHGCPDCEEVGAEAYAESHLKYGTHKMRWVEVYGETPSIMNITDFDVAEGRYFTWDEDAHRRNVAFIGNTVKETLFEEENPIGKKIRVGSQEFVVIGVAEKMDGALAHGIDEFISIPLSTHQKLYHQAGNPVNIKIRAASGEKRQDAIDQVRVVLRSARHLEYDEPDDFAIFTPDAILDFVNDFTQAFRVILTAIPLLSIIVGGIVIMNIMMISVTERTREIGIRKSIGAKRGNILIQFLYESLILSLGGGLLGVICGVLLGSYILRSLMDIQSTPTTLAVILGFGISTGVGLFFGMYPAVKASKLDPINALGYE